MAVMPQSVWRTSHLLPVDRTLRTSVADGSDTESCLPFGLRYLVDPQPSAVPDVDLAALRLDEASQIAVLLDDSEQVPAYKHTSGKTKTTTNINDRDSPDDDDDYEHD